MINRIKPPIDLLEFHLIEQITNGLSRQSSNYESYLILKYVNSEGKSMVRFWFFILLAILLYLPALGQQTASEWISEGNRLFHDGKYNESLKAFDNAIENDPNSLEAWNSKAKVFDAMEKYDQAIASFNEARQINEGVLILGPFLLRVDNTIKFSDLITMILVFIGTIWAYYRIKEYREFKHWIQFDMDANIYPLSKEITTKSYNWFEGDKAEESKENHTHAIEVLFKFNNKGKTRIKVYNIQAEFSTSPEDKDKLLDKEEGHLKFSSKRLVTGNIVPEDIGFYYIEPQVEQIIAYSTLINIPGDILRIRGMFCQDNVRIYPKKELGKKYFKHFSWFNNNLCDFFGRTYAFKWNKVETRSGPKESKRNKDNERLIRYLTKRLHIDWAGDAAIEKDNSTITVSTKEHSLLLRLNDKRSEVILEMDNKKKKLKAEIENNGLIIYEYPVWGWIFRFFYRNYCTRLLSHTVQRTYFLDQDGLIIRQKF
jgi:tetratricopeptide (TPR) repeat protein